MEIIAHIKRADGAVVTQSLKSHLESVAAYMERGAAPLGLGATARLIGLLHDLGKASDKFQRYIRYSFSHPDDHSQRGQIIHSSAGTALLYERYGGSTDERYIYLLEVVGMAIYSHHTGLLNFVGADGGSDFLRRLEGVEDDAAVKADYLASEIMSAPALDELVERAAGEMGALAARIVDLTGDDDRAVTFYQGMATRLLFSLLVDADRLDTALFMTGVEEGAEDAREALWIEFAARLEARLGALLPPAGDRERRIWASRQAISAACLDFAAHAPGLYRLTVPTGSGKTLASLRFALNHAVKYHKKRIIYVIPYTSIIDQNARVIRDILGGDREIVEFHSSVSEETEGALVKIFSERWDAAIILTTQVQLLDTLFSHSARAARRLRALSDSIIILDELQTLPIKCTFITNLALNFLADLMGATIVLTSATQPPLDMLSVPLRLTPPADIVAGADFAADFQRVRFSRVTREGGVFSADIADAMLADATRGRSVLGIVNTTLAAANIYAELKSRAAGIEILHLSTKMCPAHRKAVLRRINAHLKDSAAPPLVVISTQLVEAGVDISFPIVYRAMAGLSSIAQAAGRANRHGELAYGEVKLFELAGESLDRLPDIALGARLTKDILASTELADILDDSVLARYFQSYYGARSYSELSYALAGGATILDLLSTNNTGYARASERGESVELINLQGFSDAGRSFAVIDSRTEGVLVPYGEGEELTAELDSEYIAPPRLKALLKRSQQYMVNLFSHELARLNNLGAIRETRQGVLALSANYYSEEIGTLLDEQPNELVLL